MRFMYFQLSTVIATMAVMNDIRCVQCMHNTHTHLTMKHTGKRFGWGLKLTRENGFENSDLKEGQKSNEHTNELITSTNEKQRMSKECP